MTTEGHRVLIALIAIGCLAGCRSTPVAPYAVLAPPVTPYAPAEGSSNAFDGYELTAQALERVAGKNLTRVTFSPDERQSAQKRVEPFVRQLAREAKKPCKFEFSARGPLDSPPYQRGWRLLGWCLYWDIQDAALAGDFDRAVSCTNLATRFGFDLTGGSAIDASTGLRIVDDARKALALYLDRLSPVQLRDLEEGLKAAIARKPPISQTIENERLDMMQSIQALQDHYRDQSLDVVQKAFGSGTREPISYLKALSPSDPKRAQFFKSLTDYANATAVYANRLADTPVNARLKVVGISAPIDHAWRRLAKYVVRAPLPLIAVNDLTVARTRLFIIESELTRRRRLHMPLPADLSGFTQPLSIDPYSGAPFLYRSNGEDYMVYSVGKDGLDNAGQTDSAFLQPDLKLERSTQ